MKIIEIDKNNANYISELVADFRVALKSYKGIKACPNKETAYIEIIEYLDAGFPCFAAISDEKYVGYIVCRIDMSCVWVESIYTLPEYRGKGIASALFEKAEEIGNKLGNDTVFNYVHPNNNRMINFLRKHGYSVLNLIEIRKPHKNEKLSTTIKVGENEFNY